MRPKSGISQTHHDRGSRTYVVIHLTCANNLTVTNYCCRNSASITVNAASRFGRRGQSSSWLAGESLPKYLASSSTAATSAAAASSTGSKDGSS